MEKEQTTICLPMEARSFIRFVKTLNEKQQIGLNITLEGLNLLSEKQKSGRKNR